MGKIDEFKMIIHNDARSHCEYLNNSIKEARNKLWILTSITISVIGFLFSIINGNQILNEQKPLIYISIPFLIFNIYFILKGMMPRKKEDLHPSPLNLEELKEGDYFASKMEFYKIVSDNYQGILNKVVKSYQMCTYSTILFLFLNILFFIIRVIAEVCPY